MLDRLYVDNFRCFVNFECRLGPRQLLLGPNGSGKSTLFDVLALLRDFCALGKSPDANDDDDDRSVRFLGSTKTRWQDVPEQTFELDVSGNGGKYAFRLVMDSAGTPAKPRVVREEVDFDGKPIFQFGKGEVRLYNDRHEDKVQYPFDWHRSALATLAERWDNPKLSWFKGWLGRLLYVSPDPRRMSALAKNQEMDALQAFVASGGGLVALADNGTGFLPDNFNVLVAPYGITYANSPSEGSGHVISDFVSHLITEGLEEIGVDFQLRVTTSLPSIDLTTGSGADDALSVLETEGLAVFMSDTSIWSDAGAGADYPITFGSNTLLLENILAYVTGGGVCNGLEFIKKAKCKVKDGEVAKAIILVLNTSEGVEYTCELATGQTQTVTAGGKAKFTFKGADAPPPGPNTATVCGDAHDFNCG